MCYPKSVIFIEFLMDFCIDDNILDVIQITDKKLLHLNSQNQVKFHMYSRRQKKVYVVRL